MEQHAWSGRIDYIHDERGERGREWFTVTTHQDGHRVVRARCEMDDTEIMRDVTYSMNGFTPEEAYIRIVIKGKHEGSGWFTFDENEARCEAIIAGGGRQGEIYAALRDLRDRYAERIRAGFPKIKRRVSGYNLDQLLPENGFHVARALVGSEGTCAVTLPPTWM
jgi:hypothetical protein